MSDINCKKYVNNTYTKPIPSFKSDIHPHNLEQQIWREISPQRLTSLYGGQLMDICINDDDKTFQLMYLDLVHPNDFKTIKDAKKESCNFAKSVLMYMFNMVLIDSKKEPLNKEDFTPVNLNGKQIVIHNNNESSVDLNGKFGFIKGFNKDSGKYSIDFGNGWSGNLFFSEFSLARQPII
jgi:hypothetical protein